ncbi:MAG: GTPase HflX [Alphaproteobacteria bacterium]|nr:GTPase HflX [Alphaproteobacteria bacterium]
MNNCFVIQICLKNKKNIIDYDYKLQETINLAEALNLIVVGSSMINLSEINPATLINKGNLEDLQPVLQNSEVDALIINHPLSAIQQRNLENFLKVKVLDRSALIINIFALRAASHEGKLQSNLAALYYQKSRLVKAWSHLERQRGGSGAVGGPGETQKELDRRMIADKIDYLKVRLDKLRQNRSIQTHSRKKFNIKTIALVGYTNSGKSTLFNALTDENVLSQDLLFATLDTTSRILILPYKQKAILSDTVGFISDLPHQLVEAFHSTLDGIIDADLILHVIDSNQKNYEDQINSVQTVLKEIGISEETYKQKVIEVYNKADLLVPEEKKFFNELTLSRNGILISAVGGFNLDLLKQRIFDNVNKSKFKIKLEISYLDNEVLVYLYNNTTILEKNTKDKQITLTVLAQEKDINFINSRFSNKNIKIFTNSIS